MSDIGELESRLLAALARIDDGMGKLGAKAAESPASGDLAAALEEEKAVNAQLEARLTALREKYTAQIKSLEAQVAAGDKAVEELASLKDARKADLAEMDSVLAELKPLIREASNA